MADRHTSAQRSTDGMRLERELGRKSDEHAPSRPRTQADLELCPCCGRDLVYPLDWTPAGRNEWAVTLRCPDCEWRGGGIYSQELLDRFDEALDDGVQAVLDDLELLTKANLEAEIDSFAEALAADRILPEDF